MPWPRTGRRSVQATLQTRPVFLSRCVSSLNRSSPTSNPLTPKLALTRYNTSASTLLNSSCTLDDGYQSYSLVGTVFGVNNSNIVYDALAQVVAPVLLVWMPVANGERTSYLTSAKAGMVCAHVNTYSNGSRIPPPLSVTTSSTATATATATNTNSGASGTDTDRGLSGGAIGGIVIGVILALAVLGLLVWFTMRRRKSRRTHIHEMGRNTPSVDGDRAFLKETSVVSELDVLNSGRNELSPHGRHFAEVHGSAQQPSEMRGTEVNRQELSASKRGSDVWDWRRKNGAAHELEG